MKISRILLIGLITTSSALQSSEQAPSTSSGLVFAGLLGLGVYSLYKQEWQASDYALVLGNIGILFALDYHHQQQQLHNANMHDQVEQTNQALTALEQSVFRVARQLDALAKTRRRWSPPTSPFHKSGIPRPTVKRKSPTHHKTNTALT